jgi:hypothetical protein
LSDNQNKSNLGDEREEDMTKAERVVKYNEKDNVPIQSEEGEAETHENADVEHLADEDEIEHRREED